MQCLQSLDPGELPEQGDRILEEVTALRAKHLKIWTAAISPRRRKGS